MEILSYSFSLIATVLGLCEPFGKKMRTILIFNFCGNLLVFLSYLVTGKLSGAAICCVACVQVIINYFFDKKGKKLPLWILIIHLLSFTAVNIITFAHIYDLLALGASIIFVLSIAQTESKFYRILYCLNSMMWILYDILAKAYGNLFTHVVLSVSILIAIYVRDRSSKKEKV